MEVCHLVSAMGHSIENHLVAQRGSEEELLWPIPKGGPGSYKTQFLSSGLYGLEVGRLPSWTA